MHLKNFDLIKFKMATYRPLSAPAVTEGETEGAMDSASVLFLAPAVTVGERRELWILPPFFFGLFFCL